jgi:hypothetical protein
MIILLLRPRSNVKKTIRDSLTNKNSIFKSVYDTSQDAFAPLPHLENSVIDSFIEWIKTQKEAIKKIVPFSPEYIESINTLENILNLHESLNDPSHKEKSSISTKLLRGLLRSRPSLDLQDDPLEIISPILENLSYGQGGLPRFSFMTEQCKVFIYYCFDDGTMIEIDEKPDNLDTRTRHITTGRYKSDIHKNVVTFKLCVRDDQSDRIALKDLLKEYMDYDIKIVDQELTVKKDGTPELFFLGYKGAKTHDKIIDRMPDVMTLQIVRNNYNPISNKRVYIQPIETINGESYEVRSIVYHSSIRSNNSYNSGHYTALVKKDCEGRDIWWYCDDTTIRKATKEQIDDYLSGGFVYFLQKVDQNS